MFRKTLLTTMLVVPLGAYADSPNSVGCGLGSQIFDGQSGILPQVLAVTTNGTLGNQTFGISSGTSGCKSDGTVVASQRVPMYVGANIDALARDVSTGGGETLESLASLMQIDAEDRAEFFSTARRNYARIFPSHGVTAADVLSSLYGVMSESARLARYVPV